ncbi:MAG: hypothetical protein ACRD12_15420, partial [Acidimicrobiales bacterium]
MPRDIFGGKGKDIFGGGKGPSDNDIEREAQRELDRLTRAPSPVGGMGPMGGVGGIGGGGAPPSLGPKSPLEAMADGLTQRKKVRKKKGGSSLPATNRDEWTGFSGAAAMSGSVGSALGFGGGVAPGSMRRSPPPDAQPLRRRGEDDDFDHDDPDDDVGVTELALRDHAERSGKNFEDLVIRSDPSQAEAMREAAMQRFLQRTPDGGEGFTPPSRLNLRRRGRLRPVVEEEPEVEEDEEAFDDDLDDDEPAGIEREDGPDEVARPAGAPTVGPQLGLMVDERARLAERRADLAEERAVLAEARAQAAELELSAAAEVLADYERQLDELSAKLDELTRHEPESVEEELEDVDETDEEAEDEAPPPRRARKPPAATAGRAKKAPAARKRVPPKA